MSRENLDSFDTCETMSLNSFVAVFPPVFMRPFRISEFLFSSFKANFLVLIVCLMMSIALSENLFFSKILMKSRISICSFVTLFFCSPCPSLERLYDKSCKSLTTYSLSSASPKEMRFSASVSRSTCPSLDLSQHPKSYFASTTS